MDEPLKTEMTDSWPDLIVVLCPGNPTIEDDIAILDEVDVNGYLGSRIRLDAAIEIYLKTQKEMILIGGKEDSVRAMKLYLCNICCDPDKISLLISENGTNGNLHALRGYLDSRLDSGLPKSIGILTNAYHQHRVMLFASDILDSRETNIKIIPLVAEAIVRKTDPFTNETEKRMKNEMRGVIEWIHGKYRDQYKKRWDWIWIK